MIRSETKPMRGAPPKRRRFDFLDVLVHVGSLAPLALVVNDYQTSINPIQDITSHTGKTAIILLVLSLACSPLNMLFGWKRVSAFRKPLGLYAFMYVALHLLTFVYLDYGLDWGLISNAISEKRYVLVGFSAFLLLLPLALTSTKWAMKRLGKNWKRLHRLVYLAAPLAVLHYLWLVKADYRQPLLFGLIVAVLLVFRLPAVRRTIAHVRSKDMSRTAKTGSINQQASNPE